MAFLIHSTDDGRIPSFEYLPCSAITPKIGLALYQNAGNLALANGGTKPTYICMTERSSAVAAGTIIPVIRVAPDIIFETIFSEAATNVKIGNRVTISTNGDKITKTQTDSSSNPIGVAEIVWMEGAANGSKCRVRFADKD